MGLFLHSSTSPFPSSFAFVLCRYFGWSCVQYNLPYKIKFIIKFIIRECVLRVSGYLFIISFLSSFFLGRSLLTFVSLSDRVRPKGAAAKRKGRMRMQGGFACRDRIKRQVGLSSLYLTGLSVCEIGPGICIYKYTPKTEKRKKEYMYKSNNPTAIDIQLN